MRNSECGMRNDVSGEDNIDFRHSTLKKKAAERFPLCRLITYYL